jgi:hypothetical protein
LKNSQMIHHFHSTQSYQKFFCCQRHLWP